MEFFVSVLSTALQNRIFLYFQLLLNNSNNQKVIIWHNDAIIKLWQMIAFVDFITRIDL